LPIGASDVSQMKFTSRGSISLCFLWPFFLDIASIEFTSQGSHKGHKGHKGTRIICEALPAFQHEKSLFFHDCVSSIYNCRSKSSVRLRPSKSNRHCSQRGIKGQLKITVGVFLHTQKVGKLARHSDLTPSNPVITEVKSPPGNSKAGQINVE